MLANVCKHNVTRFPYEISRLAQDIAGGLMVTLPSEKTLEILKQGHPPKISKRKEGCNVENRMRIL